MRTDLQGQPALLTFEEAARLVGVSKTTLRKSIRQGQFMPVQAPATTGPKGLRIPLRQVESYLNELDPMGKLAPFPSLKPRADGSDNYPWPKAANQ